MCAHEQGPLAISSMAAESGERHHRNGNDPLLLIPAETFTIDTEDVLKEFLFGQCYRHARSA
jgi:hypothetical protein